MEIYLAWYHADDGDGASYLIGTYSQPGKAKQACERVATNRHEPETLSGWEGRRNSRGDFCYTAGVSESYSEYSVVPRRLDEMPT